MTREEYIKFANSLKNNYTIDFDKLPEFCDMAISALENKGDLISRQAVFNTLDNMDKALDEDRTVEKYKELLTECIKVLSPAKNDGDLISRQEILDRTVNRNSIWNTITDSEGNNLEDILNSISSVENKGEWKMPIQDDGMSDPIYYQVRCSKCGFDLDPQTWHQELHQYGADNFCPNCGADMRGE